MYQDPKFKFYVHALPPLQGAITLFLWVLIILRVRSILKANIQFPSRWRTASAILILTSGLAATAYIGCVSAKVIYVSRSWDIAASKNILEDDLILSNFTPAEAQSIADYYNKEDRDLFAARTLLTFSLWISKFAFLCFFIGSRPLISKFHQRVLDLTSISMFLMFIAVIWASFYEFKISGYYANITKDDIVEVGAWRGIAYSYFTPYLEYTSAALNVVADMTLTAMAALIIKFLPHSARGVFLLLGMLAVNVLTSTLYLIFYTLFQVNIQGSAEGMDFVSTGKVQCFLIFWTDFEVILSIIVSCVPGARACARQAKIERGEEGTVESASGSETGDYEKTELVFLTETHEYR